MIAELALIITMTLTAYAPKCGGINGNPNHPLAVPENNLVVAACGPKYPKGTIFKIKGLENVGLDRVVCRDRGGRVSNKNLDILVVTGLGCQVDYRIARQIGRRKASVEVINERRNAEELVESLVVSRPIHGDLDSHRVGYHAP